MLKFNQHWVIFLIFLTLIFSTNGYQTKNSQPRTNAQSEIYTLDKVWSDNSNTKNANNRMKRYLPFLAYAPISTHASTAYKIGQAEIHSQEKSRKKKLSMAKVSATASQSTLKFREEDNSLETALHNNKVYQKKKLRNQQAVGSWFASN